MAILKLQEYETFWSRIFKTDNLHIFKEWVQHNSDSRKWLSWFLKEKQISSILDVGCGIALDYEKYLRDNLDIKYCGIDLTPIFIEDAREKFPDANFQIASVKNIPYLDGSIDVVSCRHLLEHLENPERAIREMGRVAKCYIVIIWFIPPLHIEENKIKLARFGNDNKAFYQNTYSYDYLELIFKRNNLVLLDKQRIGTDEIWVLSK